ncbi:MAG: DNA mismatch repair protein MutS [Spirochaetales bacterium]|nr:DNA mismatch repair protein MutS [Spirochaetales bacterium]
MMRQYRRIKQDHGDAILFFRLGDFYEMFEKDAKEASALLNLTLTNRQNVPMCGIPYHASHNYIARLLKAGRKIAICEQITLPEGGRGIAERRVVEIITPGTVVDEDFLEKNSNNYLVSIGSTKTQFALAYIDLSTGDFQTTSFPWENRIEMLKKELARLAPKELLIQNTLCEDDPGVGRILDEYPDSMIGRYPDWSYDIETSGALLRKQLGVSNLKGFGIDEADPALLPIGVLLEYLEDTSKSLLRHVLSLKLYRGDDFVGLDESTQKNLELVKNLQDGGRKYTLLDVLDHTKTSIGARMLKKWLLSPLFDKKAIEERQLGADALYRNQLLLSSVREILSGVLDLERLSARVAMDRAHAKDLAAIKQSLLAAESLQELMSDWFNPWTTDAEKKAAINDVQSLLERAIHEDPSILLTEGRLIKTGFNKELDRLKNLKQNSQKVLESYLDEEKEQTKIGNLRIKYNRIIGYYLEVTKGNLSQVPKHFIRRQSLVGSERYTTDRLVELETKISGTTDQIIDLERELFLEVRHAVQERVPAILKLASWIGWLDCLCSLAQAATIHGYIKPSITNSPKIAIDDGRHPVVESYLPAGEFIPNSTHIDPRDVSFALITGPNMAGKSTYLRQVALITLMAQIGSFVPAREAEIGLVDRIYCRVGASDNLARGESTFLVEMNETAHILRSSTSKSLIIMDEVGRGTSTNDGLSIAWAVTEHLLEQSAKVLFATHFHELTFIEHPKKQNLALSIAEHGDEIVFLKKVKPGAVNHSYGIHVAKLAGVPREVVQRAEAILKKLLEHERQDALPEANDRIEEPQTSLFDQDDLLLKEIASVDVNSITPVEALNLINRWKLELNKQE